jgi:hypothetical protein
VPGSCRCIPKSTEYFAAGRQHTTLGARHHASPACGLPILLALHCWRCTHCMQAVAVTCTKRLCTCIAHFARGWSEQVLGHALGMFFVSTHAPCSISFSIARARTTADFKIDRKMWANITGIQKDLLELTVVYAFTCPFALLIPLNHAMTDQRAACGLSGPHHAAMHECMLASPYLIPCETSPVIGPPL